MGGKSKDQKDSKEQKEQKEQRDKKVAPDLSPQFSAAR
jgi:hypothetical protein